MNNIQPSGLTVHFHGKLFSFHSLLFCRSLAWQPGSERHRLVVTMVTTVSLWQQRQHFFRPRFSQRFIRVGLFGAAAASAPFSVSSEVFWFSHYRVKDVKMFGEFSSSSQRHQHHVTSFHL